MSWLLPTELKSFGKPPPAVVNVTAAVLVLLSPPNKIPKDRSWNSAKSMMGKVHRNKTPALPTVTVSPINTVALVNLAAFAIRLLVAILNNSLQEEQFNILNFVIHSISSWPFSDKHHSPPVHTTVYHTYIQQCVAYMYHRHRVLSTGVYEFAWIYTVTLAWPSSPCTIISGYMLSTCLWIGLYTVTLTSCLSCLTPLLHCIYSQVDQFLESLIKFDKENIADPTLKAVRPYLEDKEFDPDFIRSKSAAAAGMRLELHKYIWQP